MWTISPEVKPAKFKLCAPREMLFNSVFMNGPWDYKDSFIHLENFPWILNHFLFIQDITTFVFLLKPNMDLCSIRYQNY